MAADEAEAKGRVGGGGGGRDHEQRGEQGRGDEGAGARLGGQEAATTLLGFVRLITTTCLSTVTEMVQVVDWPE